MSEPQAGTWERMLNRCQADRDRYWKALAEVRAHLRPEIGGRFDHRAAVATIDAVLASPPADPTRTDET